MVTLAWRMLRQRPTSAVATFIALWFGVAVVTACGVLLESGIRYHGEAQRYAASSVLVAANDLRVVSGHGENRDVQRLALPDRGRLDAGLTAQAAALCTLGIHFTTVDTVTQTEKSLPAARVLRINGVASAVAAAATVLSTVLRLSFAFGTFVSSVTSD